MLEIIAVGEDEVLEKYSPVTHALAVVKYNEQFVLLFNKYRSQWEVAGGCLEANETLRGCVERECFEEIGCRVSHIKYIGLMRFLLKPDYFHKEERVEFGALYCAELTEEIRFLENDEMSRLHFYKKGDDIGYINEIDLKLLDYS